MHNPNSTPVAFKVKTTAPKLYCVRPNSGRIEAGQDVEVQVLLQALKEEPPAEFKCRDKFLVQSTAITPELESTNITNLWSEVENAGNHQIHERKIRCVFLPSGESKSAAGSSGETSAVRSSVTPPNYDASTSAANISTSSYNAEPPLESSFRSTAQSTSFSQPQDKTPAVLPSTGAASAGGDDELGSARREIASLRDEIESLKAKARRAAANAAPGSSAAGASQMQAQGVPVHISAIIALVAFLAAYLLF